MWGEGNLMPEQSPVNARREEIYRWVGQRLEIEIHEPTSEKPQYRAVVENFGLVGDGDTFDAAFDAIMERVTDLLDGLLHSAEPLPDRREPPIEQADASDSGDG
jgi:hypothetical protein